MSRLVVVDDSDTAIDYSSGWAAVSGSIPAEGILLDNAIFQTGHVLTANGSLSYPFNGSSIEVFGVSSQLHLQPSHSQDPSWQCMIDNIVIPQNNTALRGFPWTSYCSQGNLTNSPHVLTVNITASPTKQFWLDYIRYTPLSTDSLTDKTILVNSTDSALQFSNFTDWQNFGTAKIISSSLGADLAGFQFNFTGAGITWYSLSPKSIFSYGDVFNGARAIMEGSALATLDGVPKNFSIPSLTAPNSSDLSYDLTLFKYTSLDPTKEHTLTVTYQSPQANPMPPLSLDFLLVESSPSLVTGNSSTGTAQPSPGSSSPIGSKGTSKQSSLNVAAVVGGILGGVLALLLILLFFRYRRTQQRRARYKPKLTPANNNMVFHPDVDDTDTYAMRESTLRHSDSIRAVSPPKRETFSKPPEEQPILEERTFSQNRVSSPVPGPFEGFSNHQASASTSMSPSTRTSGMLIDFPETRWSTASPAPSSPSNPFRRLNLAQPIPTPSAIAFFDNPSRETVVPPRSMTRSNTNPFRGGTLTPTSTRRP